MISFTCFCIIIMDNVSWCGKKASLVQFGDIRNATIKMHLKRWCFYMLELLYLLMGSLSITFEKKVGKNFPYASEMCVLCLLCNSKAPPLTPIELKKKTGCGTWLNRISQVHTKQGQPKCKRNTHRHCPFGVYWFKQEWVEEAPKTQVFHMNLTNL